MNVEYYADLDDPEGLVPPERDAATGRRIPARRSKDRDAHEPPKVPGKRSPWAVAAVVAVVLLVLAGGAAAVASRGGDDQTSAATTVTAAGEGGGSGGDATTTTTFPEPPTPILYSGGQVVEQVNISAFPDPGIELACDADGTCAPLLDDLQGSAEAGWTSEAVTDMGEICISNGVAKGRQVTTMSWNLKGQGTTTIDGNEVPARITGTYSIITPGVPNCLEESRYVYEFDATPQGS